VVISDNEVLKFVLTITSGDFIKGYFIALCIPRAPTFKLKNQLLENILGFI